MRLSILDLIPLRTGQTSAQALHASRSLAHLADKLGYTRFWVAEHHNIAAIASTVPSVIIPYLAAGTQQIHFGSGGVMLANHAPFSVAEQFALLAEMYPGRIDLGLGRAPGTDALTSAILRQGLPGDGVQQYANDVQLLRELLGIGETELGSAVPLDIGGRRYDIQATGAASSPVDIWLLGSSAHSAQLAAALGLPYVFANHFGIPGMEQVLAIYRDHYQPSAQFPQPTSLVPVNVVVGETQEEAERLALPHRLRQATLRSGGKLGPSVTVEQAEARSWSPTERAAGNMGAPFLYVGTAQEVADGLTALADQFEVDELMIVPSDGAFEGEDFDRYEHRENTVRALAEQLIK